MVSDLHYVKVAGFQGLCGQLAMITEQVSAESQSRSSARKRRNQHCTSTRSRSSAGSSGTAINLSSRTQ
jgi:hypothetical protein